MTSRSLSDRGVQRPGCRRCVRQRVSLRIAARGCSLDRAALPWQRNRRDRRHPPRLRQFHADYAEVEDIRRARAAEDRHEG